MAYQINSTLGAKARYTGVSRMAKAIIAAIRRG